MSLQVNDVRDLIRLLAEHPEWRAELRPLILGDELDRLPAIVAELAEAQRSTETRVGTLAEKIDRLADTVIGLRDRLDEDIGALYEIHFERKAPSLFGRWLRRPRVVTLTDLVRFDEAETSGKISELDADALRQLDLIVSGGDKQEPGYPETLLAVEISRTTDVADLDRAEERAAILRSIGYRARAAVGGRFAPERIRELAGKRDIIVRVVEQVR